MAESKSTMVRLEKLERDSRDFKRALVQITEIPVDQRKRIEEVGDSLGARIDALGTRMEGVTDRLDRLIAVTIQERTYSVERLVDIERRLTKLEDHAGF